MTATKIKPYRVESHSAGTTTTHYRVSTHADAMALMRRATSYHAHVRMSAYLHSTDDQYKPGYYSACAELTKAAMTRFIENVLRADDVAGDEYIQIRLYAYTLPGRWNRKTDAQGKPRRRVTFYIG